ncbi:ergothioneine biosynthesis protein EgtB [Rhodomicrobium sp. Az07]|uniref:ergothioneine biosynthesis protein EgtB n=1 Tax=Rhodomicrobium sp. Az07 TaxID=2839034 RepID=UPI001BEC5AF3|nr:ergothioneine biosynthesis protein EgtB [Rhodomicrobium sp. Az07]MBT3070968.1 ergothioneine biosynthesis protein EgtB [Rhodomicrobium sp. Az07]
MPLDDYPPLTAASDRQQLKLSERLFATRALSLDIARPLSPEDQTVQAMDDASPTKWHLAHTTWFFEELLLKPFLPGYRIFDERFAYCFNSYYNSLGERHPRPRRGLLTRPRADEVIAYRAHVDESLRRLFEAPMREGALSLVEVGINHEQQHQELMLTDILALFAASPLRPAYRPEAPAPAAIEGGAGEWRAMKGGIHMVGHRGDGFAYDNEGPTHEVLLRDFRIFSRAVTNGEWLAFMEAGGYLTPSLWLADGWAAVENDGWRAPLYWERVGDVWHQMTLYGLRPAEPARPVMHVSYYEADAFARWAGARLPTEFEWEVAALGEPEPAPFDFARLVPSPAENGISPMSGDVWQWTASAYLPYPGFKSLEGPLGEYNGKFMCNQMVLRGGSALTPDGHMRPSYRNFFYPQQRWQMTGLRLASDA